eukprot:GHUV01038798.1.p2 GENE.GHUV01038798.1~~GHUV01038798.1.p2  ORF type:complete len:135 (+),score=16.33 GHUV01038798.1:744-1148(+)
MLRCSTTMHAACDAQLAAVHVGVIDSDVLSGMADVPRVGWLPDNRHHIYSWHTHRELEAVQVVGISDELGPCKEVCKRPLHPMQLHADAEDHDVTFLNGFTHSCGNADVTTECAARWSAAETNNLCWCTARCPT